MSKEYTLSYTASEINEKLGKIDNMANKSELPSKTSELVNDSGFATETYVNTQISAIPTVPTNVSAFTNDAGYIVSSQLETAVDLALTEAKESGEFDGYTPIKGTDYWTENDKEEIEADNIAFISMELAKRGQLKPEFANSIDECTDTTKLYVLPDGYIYGYIFQKGITNQIPISTDTDGSVFNGVGYQADKRISSSGEIKDSTSDLSITGFIPFNYGDVLYGTTDLIAGNEGNCNIVAYNASKTLLGSVYHNTPYGSIVNNTDGTFAFDASKLTSGSSKWQSVAYVRLTMKGISDDSIITVNEDVNGVIGDGYAWGNTGHAFVPADYEARITELEGSAEKMQEEIDELKVKTNNTSGIPDYWQTALDAGVQAINEKLCTAGKNKSAFLFYSDAHWNYGSQMSPTLLKYLYQHTGINKTFFGGDIVNNEGTDYDTMEYLWDWRNQLKGLPNHHSVVGNHDDGNATNNLFSEQYVYGYLLAAEETADIVTGDDGLYYYIDNSPEKTRYLFLDTAYKGVTTAEQDFIKQALLDTPNGWHIVVVSHIWHDTNYNTSPPTVEDLNSGAEIILAIFDNYNSRNGEYADCGGWVEFCIGGHTHWDFDSTSTTGIPIILVETDSKHVRSGLGFTAGTTTESSVNGIIADYDNHKIYVCRIGRGESREIEITNYIVSYTNVLPLALAADGTSVYNGKGWKEDTRWSPSGNAERTAEGVCLTGWIPISAGDIVYLKNIVMPTGTGHTGIVHFFANSFTEEAGTLNGTALDTYNSAVRDTDGNLIQFNISGSTSYTHIRIQCGGITEASIITINEPID